MRFLEASSLAKVTSAESLESESCLRCSVIGSETMWWVLLALRGASSPHDVSSAHLEISSISANMLCFSFGNGMQSDNN